MPGAHVDPVERHLPKCEPRGTILVISDYRPLNLGHAAALVRRGYAVYTAVTCTDVPRVFERFDVGQVDLVVFASLVHGWHHREAEARPAGIPEATDGDWQTRNMVQALEAIGGRQGTCPRALIALELMEYGWYKITAETLAAAGIDFQTYSVSNPQGIVQFMP
ncbi:MAG: hypothetical protein FJX74_08180 [Armatimonadetes bacterium]|nr:hypothetical protein [Armatimonadota bacterium]